MSTAIHLIAAAVLFVCAIAAGIYRIDQPEQARAGHATRWAALFAAAAVVLLLTACASKGPQLPPPIPIELEQAHK